MSAKLIILLAIVGATCALTVSPKYRRDVQASDSASAGASASESVSTNSSSNASSGSSTGASSGSNTGASSGSNTDASAGSNSGASSGGSSDASSGGSSDTSSGSNSGSNSDSNSDSNSGSNSGSNSDSNSGGSSDAVWWWTSNSVINIQKEISAVIEGVNHVDILDLSGFGYLKSKLSEADYTNITFVAKIPTLRSLLLLPPIANIRSDIAKARASVTVALGGFADLQTAIQAATIKALHAPSPVPALANMCYTILNTYYTLAVNSPLYLGTATLLEEGMQVVSSTLTAAAKIVVQVNV